MLLHSVENVQHRLIRDEYMYRYEYFGMEFIFDYDDVMSLPSNHMGLSRLEFFFRLESLKRYKQDNVQIDITFTVLVPTDAQHQDVNSVKFTTFANASDNMSPDYNVACVSETLTTWFNGICERFPLPLKLGVKVEKYCDIGNISCRRLVLVDVFGLALLHYCA